MHSVDPQRRLLRILRESRNHSRNAEMAWRVFAMTHTGRFELSFLDVPKHRLHASSSGGGGAAAAGGDDDDDEDSDE